MNPKIQSNIILCFLSYVKMSNQSEIVQVGLMLNLTQEVVATLDRLKSEYGVKTRQRVVEILLTDLLSPDEDQGC